MADNEKDNDVTPSRGADWEVVQLTASTYAAAPNPQETGVHDVRTGHENSSALFMSTHFVFPPTEHENLPLEPETSEILDEAEGEDVEENIISEEKYLVKSDDIPHGIESLDIGNTSSLPTKEYEDFSILQGVYSDPCPKDTDILDSDDSPYANNDFLPKHAKSSEDDESDKIPSEGWWKKHASSMYRQAKETNTFWSIFVAAALTGIVILGRRWHHVNDQKTVRVLGPINRIKDIIKSSR